MLLCSVRHKDNFTHNIGVVTTNKISINIIGIFELKAYALKNDDLKEKSFLKIHVFQYFQISSVTLCLTPFTERSTRQAGTWVTVLSIRASQAGRSLVLKRGSARPPDSGPIRSHSARKEVRYDLQMTRVIKVLVGHPEMTSHVFR